MVAGLVIYFIALAVLAGVFLRLAMFFMKSKSKNQETREGAAFLTIIFFIAFVIIMFIIAETGYNLASPETSAMPPWLQEYWS